jgi:hypothetical protein
MKTKVQMMLTWAVVASILFFLAGCATMQPTTAKSETIKEPTVGLETETVVEEPGGKVETSVSWAGYTPEVMDKMKVTEVAFPTGNKKTSAILLHEVMPVEVLRGGEYTYEYHVTNLTDLTHQNVTITNEGARNLKVVSSSPAVMEGEGDSLRWVIGDLGPRETKVIRVKATSEVVGAASDCVSVTYANTLCALTKVVDPDLLLIKTAKSDGHICDDFWFTYEVVNPGSGMAKNIRIRDEIPRGLRTVEGNKSVVEIAAGDLAPGERKKFTVKAKGVETGKHRSIAVATADGGLISESENIETLIYQPVLTIAADSPARQYLGRNVDLTYRVKNTGDAVAKDTVVTAAFTGAKADVVQALQNGTVAKDKVTWQLGALGVNESKTVSVKLKGTTVGTISSSASANAECAEEVKDVTTTAVLGISAILLELVDAGDPAEIGDIVTYTVTATNQGSAADTNIAIVCEIPVEQEYLSTQGPTQGTLRGGTLTFAPVAVLEVGEKVQWNIQVRAKKVGDVRFGVSMTTDQLKAKVQETEATTIY